MAGLKHCLKELMNKVGIEICKFDKNYFFTNFYRPIYTDNIAIDEDYSLGDSVAIIIQGAIKYENDFTLETLKLYRRQYPKAKIILSTWKGEDEMYIKKIENVGIIVIQSELPMNPGHGSINYQKESTQKGILKAVDYQCKYILKTRTDQRLYADKCISMLYYLVTNNPLKIDTKAKNRIVTCSNGTFFGRLYNYSDMVLFGTTEDLLLYFSCPYDERGNEDIIPDKNLVDYSKMRPGEIYFSTYYLENLGYNLKWTEEDSLYYLKELFVVVDCETLDWFWPKYSNSEYRWRNYKRDNLNPITNRDWVFLQQQN